MVFKQGARFFDELTSFQKGGMLFGKRAYAFWKKVVCFWKATDSFCRLSAVLSIRFCFAC